MCANGAHEMKRSCSGARREISNGQVAMLHTHSSKLGSISYLIIPALPTARDGLVHWVVKPPARVHL